MNRYVWRRRVRYESLEQRQMMAVNISASDNNLLITTDSASNKFGLMQDGIGRLFIYGEGLTSISGDGTVAGQVPNTNAGGGRMFNPSEFLNIFVICGSGDDVIEFAGLRPGDVLNLYVDTGDGAADQVIFNTSTFIDNNSFIGANLVGETVTVISGDGNDTHHFNHLSAKNLVVNSGNGNDNMLFASGGDLSITDNVYIDTGDVFLPGNGDTDMLQIGNSGRTFDIGGSLDIRCGNSNAFFDLKSSISAKNVSIVTNSGNDFIRFGNSASLSATGSFSIDTGDGEDEVLVNRLTAGKLRIDVGADNDQIGIGANQAVSITTTLTIFGEDGNDTIAINEVTSQSVTVNSGAGNDTIQLALLKALTVSGDLSIDTGDGASPANRDTVEIGTASLAASISGSVDIKTGTGNDILRIDNITNSKNISLSTGAGGDWVILGHDAAISVANRFSIDTGDDADEIDLDWVTAGKLRIDTGAGGDQVDVGVNHAVSTTSAFVVFTDDGDDTANIVNVTVGGDTHMSLGDGTNTLKIKNFSSTKNTSVSGGTGVDTFWSLGGTYGNLNASLGSQANRIYFSNSNIAGNLSLVAGSDGDIANLVGVTVGGDVSLSLGDGANKLSLTNLAATKNTSVSSGGGSDQISLSGGTYGNLNMAFGDGANNIRFSSVNVSQNISFTTGSGVDTVLVKQTTAKMLIANTGSGADWVRITTNTAIEQLYANLAEGDDSLRISNSQLSSFSLLDGGTGTNIVRFASVAKPKLSKFNFVA